MFDKKSKQETTERDIVQYEMMRARISLQAQYEKDKEVYAEKMREKERKKLLEKLSRYKGVGELGHNMQDNRMAYEKKATDMLNARDLQQAKYEAEKAEYLARKAEKEEKIREVSIVLHNI
ncbi:hypothetical protein AAG570_004059 [Ranatra chinensis]|uniref:Uncharacterized protein n=1 Tax=Ranatra chinensis TaxID=642074 RepID=A0ABD0Y2R4_9HEMI